MNASELATIGGFILTLGGVLVMFGTLKNKLDNTCERQREDREANEKLHDIEKEDNARKFSELYASRNSADITMGKFGTMIEQIFESLKDINTKIDRALQK